MYIKVILKCFKEFLPKFWFLFGLRNKLYPGMAGIVRFRLNFLRTISAYKDLTTEVFNRMRCVATKYLPLQHINYLRTENHLAWLHPLRYCSTWHFKFKESKYYDFCSCTNWLIPFERRL